MVNAVSTRQWTERTTFGAACETGFDDAGAAVFEAGAELRNAFRDGENEQNANIRFRWLWRGRDATRWGQERPAVFLTPTCRTEA